jgi:hypothetical protein
MIIFYDYFISLFFFIFLVFLITKIYKNNSLEKFELINSSDINNLSYLNIKMDIIPMSLPNVIAYYPSDDQNIITNNNKVILWLDSINYENNLNLSVNSNNLNIDNTNIYPMVNFPNGESFIKSNQPTKVINQITGFMAIVKVNYNNRYNYLFSPFDEKTNLSFRSFGSSPEGDNNENDLQKYGYLYYNGTCVYDTINNKQQIYNVDLTQDIFIVYINFQNLNNSTSPFIIPDEGTNITLGSTFMERGFIGSIGDIILFNNKHTTKDQIYMEGYLAKKWKLQDKLDENHIFYKTN